MPSREAALQDGRAIWTMTDREQQVFRIYYVTGTARRPGPSFATLEAALSRQAELVGEQACDILCPDGSWYGERRTVGLQDDTCRDDAETQAIIDETVTWMQNRPSRGSGKK